jgi:hypothetical protein
MSEGQGPVQTLRYEALPPAERYTTVRRIGDELQIVRQQVPAWAARFAITCSLATGAMWLCMSIVLFRVAIRSYSPGASAVPTEVLRTGCTVLNCMALPHLAVAAYQYFRRRKWAGCQGVLIVNSDGISFVRPGVWNLRTTYWSGSSIKRIVLRRAKSLWGTTHVAYLRIHTQGHFPRRFRLRTDDPAVLDSLQSELATLPYSGV